MLERNTNELKFIRSRDAKPTVEVSAESLEAAGLDLTDTLESVLARFSKQNPGELATISLYGSMSVNFHEPAWSEFIIVDGSKRVLQAVASAFAGRHAVKSRFSDHVPPTAGQPIIHLEGGRCWQVLDAVTWFAKDDDPSSSEAGASNSPGGEVKSPDDDAKAAEEDADGGEDWDVDDAPDGAEPSEPAVRRGRLRAARSDAKLGTIKQTIEEVFGLPAGSVALCGPDRKPLRADATIGTLRRRWSDS